MLYFSSTGSSQF